MKLGAVTLLLLGWLLLAGPGLGVTPSTAEGDTGRGAVVMVEIVGGIGPATRDHVKRAIDHATGTAAVAVVLRIDTPGGLDAATRDINAAILASEVPVIGWVAPEGARAASAGTYILYATHLAAMAPATSMGAATPVSMGGPGPAGGARDPGDAPDRDSRRPAGQGTPEGSAAPRGPERDAEPDATSTGRNDRADRAREAPGTDRASRKAINDAVAYLRSLAELRGRDARFAEEAVRDAATLTASQARARGVVELIAPDLDALLAGADGRTVRLRGGEVALTTAGRTVERFEPDWRTRLLAVITEPTVAYLLLLVGVYGLAFEGYSPGAVVPGVVGAISLLLALYAMQVLPVNYAGLALIALGVALMVAELMMPSFGALGIGGAVALVAGSLILFDTGVPGFGVPVALVGGIAVASAAAFTGALWLAARARRQPVVTGIEELIGQPATALQDFQGIGRVRVHGEVWQARSDAPVLRGAAVRIRRIDGLVLQVGPESARQPPGTPEPGVGPP